MKYSLPILFAMLVLAAVSCKRPHQVYPQAVQQVIVQPQPSPRRPPNVNNVNVVVGPTPVYVPPPYCPGPILPGSVLPATLPATLPSTVASVPRATASPRARSRPRP
jgi:hypothetical protein